MGNVDETYSKDKDARKYLCRAVDKEGKIVDFLLASKRDKTAAERFFERAKHHNGDPKKVTVYKSGAKKATINEINHDRELSIEVRQIKYLNNIVEQDRRAIKPMTKPMLNFKSFRSAQSVLAGIELMHMIRKGQMAQENQMLSAEQFYALGG